MEYCKRNNKKMKKTITCFDYYFNSQYINSPSDYVDEIYDAEPIPFKSNSKISLHTINESNNEDNDNECKHCCDEDNFYNNLYTSFLQWTRNFTSW